MYLHARKILQLHWGLTKMGKNRIMAMLFAAFLTFGSMSVMAAPATDSLDIGVHKAVVKPSIDGTISAAEWGEAVMYQEAGVGLTYFPDEDGGISDQAVKATIYMLWDEDGFYVAASVEDAAHFNKYENLDIWNGDAFEFDSNFNKDDYSDRNRQCYGINNDGKIYGGSYKVASGVDWAENSDIEYAQYTAVVNGTTTNYEFFVPWTNFCPDGSAFAAVGNAFRGNVQFHLALDGDYVGCQRYCKVEGENSTYPTFTLMDAVVLETVVDETPATEDAPAAEEAPQAQTTAAQTSDAFAGVAALASAAAVGAFVIAKKNRK